jgi:pilus assembly protein Flp/PilA
MGNSEGGLQMKSNLIIQKGITTMLFALKEKGQGLVEYAIILALIAIVVIAVMGILGKKVNNTFNSIQNSLPS